jgi:hypothetical protein
MTQTLVPLPHPTPPHPTLPHPPFLNTKIALFFDYLGISYKTHVGKEGEKKNPSQTNNNILYQNSYHTTKTTTNDTLQ